MNHTRHITLLTDFGTQDGYPASMKGVIYNLATAVQITDISHDITPFDIQEASYILHCVYPYFPFGTIHVCVVDPGVGTERRNIIVECGGHFFVGPDNGLLPEALQGKKFTAYTIDETVLATHVTWPKSSTFHGRDIYAPAAALLAGGNDITSIAHPVPDIVTLPPQTPAIQDGLTGRVLHIDQFGNIASTIHRNTIDYSLQGMAMDKATVVYKDIPVGPVRSCFADGAKSTLVAYFNSSGFLEIAQNQGNAAAALKATKGDKVYIAFPPKKAP